MSHSGNFSWGASPAFVDIDLGIDVMARTTSVTKVENKVNCTLSREWDTAAGALCRTVIARIVRVGPVTFGCDLTAAGKLVAKVGSSGGEWKSSGTTRLDLQAGYDSEGQGAWGDPGESGYTSESTAQGPSTSSEIGIEVGLDFMLTAGDPLGGSVARVGIAQEVTLGTEIGSDIVKYPVKTRTLARLDVAAFRHEKELHKWEHILHQENLSRPSAASPVPSDPASEPSPAHSPSPDAAAGAIDMATAIDAEEALNFFEQTQQFVGEVVQVSISAKDGDFFEILEDYESALHYDPTTRGCTNHAGGRHCFFLTLEFPYSLEADEEGMVHIEDTLRITETHGRQGFLRVTFDEP